MMSLNIDIILKHCFRFTILSLKTIMTSPGYASISAIVVLECPRPINPGRGLKNIALDANFYVTEGSKTACLGLIRHFASDDLAVELRKITDKSFQKAFIVANVFFFLFFYFYFYFLLIPSI